MLLALAHNFGLTLKGDIINNIWLISDQHFGHSNIIRFKVGSTQQYLRPFATTEEMDELMIHNHNSVVGKNDRIYFLGDVAFNHKILDAYMPRLNGRKVLIKGNHDNCKLSQYAKHFDDIRAFDRKAEFILAHVPIHTSSLGRFKQIHGHTHSNRVTHADGTIDNRYLNVCVEVRNYTPVSLDSLIKESNS